MVLLSFDKDSVLKAIIYQDSSPRFTISTTDPAASHTKIKDAESQRLLMSIRRRTFFSDTVTFSDRNKGNPVKVKEWLKKKPVANGYFMSVLETSSGTYYWKSNQTHRRALFASPDDESEPIAQFQPGPSPYPFSIKIEPEAEGFQEDILASFLILELKTRAGELAWRKASGMALSEAQSASPLTGHTPAL